MDAPGAVKGWFSSGLDLIIQRRAEKRAHSQPIVPTVQQDFAAQGRQPGRIGSSHLL
jgi:hypothetical protein